MSEQDDILAALLKPLDLSFLKLPAVPVDESGWIMLEPGHWRRASDQEKARWAFELDMNAAKEVKKRIRVMRGGYIPNVNPKRVYR